MAINTDWKNIASERMPAWNEKVARRLIIVPLYDADGALNKLDNEAAVTKSALQAKLQAENIYDRWFITPQIVDPTDERAEDVMHEFETGQKEFIREGERSFSAKIPAEDMGINLLSNLKSFKDKEIGFYEIDTDGNFIYRRGSSGEVYPIPIRENSFTAHKVAPTPSELSRIMINFQYDTEFDDGDTRYIVKEDLDFDGRKENDLFGLRDVEITEVSNTLTTLKVNVVYEKSETPVTGYEAVTNWYLYNTTDSEEITPTAVVETEDTPGEYTLTFAEQTTSDAYSVNMTATGGFDPDDTLTGTLTS